MSERSDYQKPSRGKFGERSRGEDGGDTIKEWTEGPWDPKSKRASWDKVPPPASSHEEFPALPRKDKQNQEDARSEENEETAGELPLKVPDASSSSSSHTKKKKWKVTEQHFLTNDELWDLLRDFIKTCAFDSYGAKMFCISDKENNKLYEYKYFSRAVYALNLPAACPVRVEQEDSKEELAAMAYRVVKTMLDDGRIGPKEGGGWGFKKYPPSPSFPVAGSGFPIDGHGGALMLPILQDTRSNRFRSKQVNLLTIEHETEKAWGIVVASPIEHSYQLTVGSVVFRLKVEDADWSPEENLEIVERFHRRIIGEDEDPEPDLMLVKVKEAKAKDRPPTYEIDFESMKDLELDEVITRVRGPFTSLLAKMKRLAWWELVRRYSPAEPAPSPLKLHKIFDQPASPEEQKEFEADVQCMKICGMDSLRLAAAVSESAQERERLNPDLSWECLEKKVQDTYLNEDLAAHLMALSGLLRLGTRQGIEKSHAAEMFFALIGAYKMESDMFAVVQLWDYLVTDPDDPYGPPRPSTVKRLGRANEFTAGVPRFTMRTSSYMEFGEVYQHQLPWIKEDPPVPRTAKALRVRYEEYSDAYYRWNGSQAEECRPETPGREVWTPLTYDYAESCFCSPSMKLPTGEPRPLPTKIHAWMRGRSMKKLVSIKHSMETTPPYKFLREHLDDESRDVLLIVDYKQHGEVRYKRDHLGGLGFEIYQDQVHLLSFSESKKTLVSGVALGQALPRKVVTWLLEYRNLADLIPGRKRQVLDLKYEEDKAGKVFVEFVAPRAGQKVRVKAKEMSIKPVGPHGCLFEVFVEGSEKAEVVSYSEERKEWVYYSGTHQEDMVPWEAIAFIADKAATEAGPRLTTPTSVKKFFPKASGTAVARIEQQADHRFLNVKYLAEALTHCSAINAAVQPCDQLAYVGMAAMNNFASETVMKADAGRRCSSGWLGDASFFNSHLVCTEGPVNHENFCAPKEGLNWDLLVPEARPGVAKPQPPQPEKDQPGSLKAMKARIWACCNHVSYASSCIKSDLHKNINMSSTDLQEHIEKVCRKFPKDKENTNRWPQLFKLGAPKALGDVFLATVGAISLDSDHNEAKHLMKKHYQESLEVYLAMGGNQAEELGNTIYGNRDLVLWPSVRIKEALQLRHKLNQQEFALVPSLQLEEGGELPDFVSQCKDLQVIKVEGYGEIACSSPRSVYNSVILSRMAQDGADESDENSESVAEEDPDSKKYSEQEGAIYCKPCQMWLNGPTQWADHEIGKKHRKAVHRMQAAKQELHFGEDIKKGALEKAAAEQHEHEIIFCKYCEMWLNGPTQWADHEVGKKHQKAMKQAQEEEAFKGQKASSSKAPDDPRPASNGTSEVPMEAEPMRQDLPMEPYPGAYQYPNTLYDTNPVNTFQEFGGSWYAPWGNPTEEVPQQDIPMPLEWQ